MQIHHEPIGAYGGITAEAIGNLLNGSDVDLGTFLRETIQNSWDAGIRDKWGAASVRANLSIVRIPDPGRNAVTHCLAADAKFDMAEIKQALQCRALVYSDRGTTGLNGPIPIPRPGDGAAAGDDKRNFVNFVWMLGANDGGENKGGQFGFGKSVFAGASRIRMYAIHTRVRKDSGFEHRFVICGMRRANQNNSNGRGYTGRFWIGENGTTEGHSVVALNDRAREMAGWFGIDSFTGDDTGTTVAIFHPKWQWAEENETHFLNMARRAVVKWFWPLLSEGNFKFTTGGHAGEIKEAVIDGGFAVYERLFKRCKEKDAALSNQTPGQMITGAPLQELMNDDRRNIRLVCADRPFKPLGILGMSSSISTDHELNNWGQNPLRFETQADDDDAAQTVEDIPDPVNTLALIRAARMVVSYEPVDHRAGPDKTVFGVFVAASRDMHQRNGWSGSNVNQRYQSFAVEDILAKSEPPRHDEWNPVNITSEKARLIAGNAAVGDTILGNLKTFARRAVEESRRIFAEWCRPPKPKDPGAFEFVPAGEASWFLSDMVFKTPGNGPGKGPEPIVIDNPEPIGGTGIGGYDKETGKGPEPIGGHAGVQTAGGNGGGATEGGTGGSGKDKKVGNRNTKRTLPKFDNLSPAELTETPDGRIEFSIAIDTTNWPAGKEFKVEALVFLVDGENKQARLTHLAPIGGATTGAAFAIEERPEQTGESVEYEKEEKDNINKAGSMNSREMHGFFKNGETPCEFQEDGNTVILKARDRYTYKLRTDPGKVLDIKFVAKQPSEGAEAPPPAQANP